MLKFQAYDREEEERIPAGESSGEIRPAMEENISSQYAGISTETIGGGSGKA